MQSCSDSRILKNDTFLYILQSIGLLTEVKPDETKTWQFSPNEIAIKVPRCTKIWYLCHFFRFRFF